MKFGVNAVKAVRKVENDGAQYRRDLRAAAIIMTDELSKEGQRDVQAKIRAVGLGKLGGAVGHTSMKKEGQSGTGRTPYGVIFAKGGDESLGGGALESYSRGSRIKPTGANGDWLWIPQPSVPRFMRSGGRRRRLTPALYNASSLASTIGKLVFKPISATRALLVIRKASVNIRTGRAKAPLKRKSNLSTNEKDVIAFVGIKVTRRAKRFDQTKVMQAKAQKGPRVMREALDRIRKSRA